MMHWIISLKTDEQMKKKMDGISMQYIIYGQKKKTKYPLTKTENEVEA